MVKIQLKPKCKSHHILMMDDYKTIQKTILKLIYKEDKKAFKPEEVYGDAPNPTKL